MNNYPDAVAKIANDYLERVKSRLSLVPARERDEFLKELQSHLYEAYQETPGEDDIARILQVLRNLGEPAEVVADRLPGAMVRSGARRNRLMYVAGGILIALFGIPLGFGGIGVMVGILFALTGLVTAYCAITGSILLMSALIMLMGLTHLVLPQLWDRLVTLGVIQINGPPAEFLDGFTPADQGLLMILLASLLGAGGFGMLRLGKRLLHGLRFLFSLVFDQMRRFAQTTRRKLRRSDPEPAPRYAATRMTFGRTG